MKKTLFRHIKLASQSAFADRLQRPQPRRLIVSALVIWILVAGWAFPMIVDSIWLLALTDLIFLALAALLVLSIYGVFELPDDDLDEYQLQIRNACYKSAHSVSLVVLLVGTVLTFGLGLPRSHAFGIALMACLTMGLLPRALAAWQLDSPTPDHG